MGIKGLILKKGWAGRTLGRQQTVHRIDPLIRIMNELMQLYGGAARDDAHAEHFEKIEASLRTLRMDIGKMCEIVYSSGGVAYNGTDLNPDDFDLGDGLSAAITGKEAALEVALKDEAGIEHQMRSRAILENVEENQKTRLKALRGL